MSQLIGTTVAVVVVAGTVGGFVGLNTLIDLAVTRFRRFATVSGLLLGAAAGGLANSGRWFLGGPLWPLGGAVLGTVIGGLVVARRPPPVEQRRRLRDRLRPAVFVGPALAFLTVALVVPTLRTVYLSFRRGQGDEAAGLANYRDILGDDDMLDVSGAGDILTSRLFLAAVGIAGVTVVLVAVRGWRSRRGVDLSAPAPAVSLTTAGILGLLAAMGSLRGVIWNNVFWVVFVTAFSTIIGLAIAVLADRARGESLAKSLIFMPMAISFVGASIIWRFVYAFEPAGSEQIGLLNAVWVAGGGAPQAWVQSVPWNSMLLIVIMIWIQTGFAMVVLSSAIKAVPAELIEAARMDGAGEGQAFWRVTVPQIRSTVAVVATTLIITVLKVYDIVKVMTNGEFDTSVIANEMFEAAFTGRGDYGEGSALAVLLLAAVVPLMVVNVRRLRRGERA